VRSVSAAKRGDTQAEYPDRLGDDRNPIGAIWSLAKEAVDA